MELVVFSSPLPQSRTRHLSNRLTFAGGWQPGLQMAAMHLGRPAVKAVESSAFRHGTSRGDAFGLRLPPPAHQGKVRIFTK
jgi:hypothetical protein